MRQFNVTVNGETFFVEIEEVDGKQAPATAQAVAPPQAAPAQTVTPPPVAPQPQTAAEGDVVSPLPGTVLRLFVKPGQKVKAGEVLLILEAMKMENEIVAPADGIVAEVYVEAGATVQSGDVLVHF